MTSHALNALSPRVQEAITELEGRLSARYPDATYTLLDGSDPNGIWIMAEVDIEDLLDVADVIAERELELQVEEGLAIYVFPTRPARLGGKSDASQTAPRRLPTEGR